MSGSGRQLGAVNLVEALDGVTLDKSLLDAKSSVPPPPRPGLVSRGEMIQEARSGGWRVVGVTAPAGYGKSTLLAEWARTRTVGWRGCRWTVTTTNPRPACITGVGVCSSLSRPRRPGRRHGRPRCVDAGPRRAAAGLRASGEPGPVRAHARRPSRATLTGLPRRAGGGHLGHSRRAPNWSLRAVPSSRTCRACAPPGRRWSSWPATWPSTRPAPSRSSRRLTSP